jgi:hypothetical protein
MRRFHRFLTAAGLALVTACSASGLPPGEDCHPDPTSQALEVVITLPADLGERRVELFWRDRPGEVVFSDGYGFGELHLFRSFGSRAEADAFGDGFVVRVDGVEVGSDAPSASACDQVAVAAGVAPEDLHLLERDYALQIVYAASAGLPVALVPSDRALCATSPRTLRRLPCDLDRRVLQYAFVATGALAITVDGVPHPIHSVAKSSSSNQLVYQLELELPTLPAIAGQGAALAATLNGADVGGVHADFAPCISLLGAVSDESPEELRAQRVNLRLAGGTLAIDSGGGVFCETTTSVFAVVP